jgi:hypothetical protein
MAIPPATPPSSPAPAASDPHPLPHAQRDPRADADSAAPHPSAGSGGTRTSAGSSHGDWAPPRRGTPAQHDPSRGAELERDQQPADADFGRPPPRAGDVDHTPAPSPARGPGSDDPDATETP